MKKLIIAAVIAMASAAPAYAMVSFLVAEWIANGDQFCRYENGTVLNVGYRVCPLQIQW